MTFTISPFLAGVLCTFGCEILAFIIYVIVYTLKTRKNTSNSTRSDKNE